MALTMSHKWTSDSIQRISDRCMAEVKGALEDDKFLWYISYDNVNIPFRVFSQRLENQGEFINGTAATVYVKPDGKPLSNNVNQDLREKRVAGAQRPLTEMDITRLAMDSHHDILEHIEYHILRFLLDSPEFELKLYNRRHDPALLPPLPLRESPHWPRPPYAPVPPWNCQHCRGKL